MDSSELFGAATKKSHDFLTKVLKYDNCPYKVWLYTMRKERIFLCSIYYSNDLLTASKSCGESLRMKTELNSYFKMKDLGPVRKFLGIQTTRDHSSRSLFLPESSFVDRISSIYQLIIAKQASTPIEVPSSDSSPPNLEPLH